MNAYQWKGYRRRDRYEVEGIQVGNNVRREGCKVGGMQGGGNARTEALEGM